MEITPLASGSSGNAYLIKSGGCSLLIECGLPFKRLQRALSFNVSSLDAALISHEHLDHAKSVKELMRAGVDCYMSAGTAEALGVAGHRKNTLTPKVGCGISPCWYVYPFQVEHDAAEPLGFVVAAGGERLCYITDSAYSRYRFAGINIYMIEVNYMEKSLRENIRTGIVDRSLARRLKRTHFSLENAVDFFKANDLSAVREVWALHLSSRNSDEALIKNVLQQTVGKPVYIAEPSE